jgi:hypothetical protein
MKARDRVKGWPHPRSTTRAVGFYGDRRLFDILQWEAQEAADEQRRAYGSAESRLVFLAKQNGLRLAGAKESHRFYVVEEIWGRGGLYQEYIDGSNVHETYALTKNRKKEVTIVVKSSGESLQGEGIFVSAEETVFERRGPSNPQRPRANSVGHRPTA